MRAHACTLYINNTCALYAARDQLFRNIAFGLHYFNMVSFVGRRNSSIGMRMRMMRLWCVDENHQNTAAITPAPNANTYLNLNLDLSQRIFTHSKFLPLYFQVLGGISNNKLRTYRVGHNNAKTKQHVMHNNPFYFLIYHQQITVLSSLAITSAINSLLAFWNWFDAEDRLQRAHTKPII